MVYALEYEARELHHVEFSHSFFGVPNPKYPHDILQPRNSTSPARHLYLSKIYQHFDAWQFVAEFRQLSLGTPIFIANFAGVGNGRCAILEHAYQQNGWQSKAYREAVATRASQLGLDISGLVNPILGRRVLSEIDVFMFVHEANMRINQSYSKDEWASVDARFISGDLLLQLDIRESPEETFKASSNARFVSHWIGSLPESERAQVLDPRTNYIDLSGIARLERALIARVYGSNWLTRLTYDSFDNDIRSVTNGLRWSVIKVAMVEELVAQGRRAPSASIAHEVLRAVEMYFEAKESTAKNIEGYLGQKRMFSAPTSVEITLLKMFERHRRSPKKIKASLERWCDHILAMPDKFQMALKVNAAGH